jgi:hypothetical protein
MSEHAPIQDEPTNGTESWFPVWTTLRESDIYVGMKVIFLLKMYEVTDRDERDDGYTYFVLTAEDGSTAKPRKVTAKS